MIDMSALRAFEARGKAAWFADKGPHPHGLSGHRHIIPAEESRDMWDTHPRGRVFSEWGNEAVADDLWRSLPADAVAFVLELVPELDRTAEWHRLSDLLGQAGRDALSSEQRDRLARLKRARK